MGYVNFDPGCEFDLIPLGRIAIDLNPLEYAKPFSESETFRKYVGGSPANIAVGLSRLGKRVGFIGRVADDALGTYALDFFKSEGIDVECVKRCSDGERMGLAFTEVLAGNETNLIMYRDGVADLRLCIDDIDSRYIARGKALLVSGTALAGSPSREAALKALLIARNLRTPVIFDIDYRDYTWRSQEETGLYYAMAAGWSDIIMGSREEFDLMAPVCGYEKDDAATAKHWHSSGASIVVIKHGKSGSTAYARDGKSYSIKPFPVDVQKRTGGGDGYASAFIYGLLEGWDIGDALEFGSASASLLVASHGCSEHMPDVQTIREFIKKCSAEGFNARSV
jgi:5-dehydro-2-deoxygluconokinase